MWSRVLSYENYDIGVISSEVHVVLSSSESLEGLPNY